MVSILYPLLLYPAIVILCVLYLCRPRLDVIGLVKQASQGLQTHHQKLLWESWQVSKMSAIIFLLNLLDRLTWETYLSLFKVTIIILPYRASLKLGLDKAVLHSVTTSQQQATGVCTYYSGSPLLIRKANSHSAYIIHTIIWYYVHLYIHVCMCALFVLCVQPPQLSKREIEDLLKKGATELSWRAMMMTLTGPNITLSMQ